MLKETRDQTSEVWLIRSPDSSNRHQALRGDQFKEALVTFLVDYLENDNSARILGSKKLIVNNGDTCYSFIS